MIFVSPPVPVKVYQTPYFEVEALLGKPCAAPEVPTVVPLSVAPQSSVVAVAQVEFVGPDGAELSTYLYLRVYEPEAVEEYPVIYNDVQPL